jgi:hypothetical protein
MAGPAVLILAGLAILAAGLAGSVAFFGQGAEEEFQHWTNQALLQGGAVAILAGGAGIAVAWLAARPRARRLGVAAAALLAGAQLRSPRA